VPDGDKIVRVPGVGAVRFPGSMDDASVNQAIEQHLAAMQPGAMQSRKGGPILNVKQLTAPDDGSTAGTIARESVLGAASGVGIPETMNPVSDLGSNLTEQAKTIGKFWTLKPEDMKASMTTNPVVAVPGAVTSGFGNAMDAINPLIDNFFRKLTNVTGGPQREMRQYDVGKSAHDIAAFGTQLATLKGGEKVPEAIADPIGKSAFQNTAREILNEGPSKVRVLADQHAHALELQKHVAGVADAVHQDAQQAMAQVSQAVDSAKPEGAFDKAEVRGRVSAAMGDTLEDQSQLPTSLKKLTTPEKPSMANFVNKNTADFVNRLKQGGMAPDEIAQALKEQGFQPNEIKAAVGDIGTTQAGRMTFEEVKQARSDLGRQMGRLQGPAQAAASAAYGELSKILREGARDASQEPQWIDANAKWKGYLDDFHRSPIAKTLAGENASDIMEPLTGKSRVQTLDILSKYEPFGINMDKINQEVGRSGAIDTVQRLSRPTKMDLLIAKLSPTSAGLRAGVPRMLRNPAAADFLGGKGFEPENISPKKVYPNKAAAAAALKGGGDMPRGNPTPFGGASDAMMRQEVLRESLAAAEKKLQGAKGAERGIIQRQIDDFKDMLGETQ
jgi:hypothetical protein